MPTNLNIGILASGVYGVAIANTVAPTVTGTPTHQEVLSVSLGTWTGEPISYTYQWQRGSTNISGATGSTYALVAADVGSTIRCVVTASNHFGDVAVTTASTATVAGIISATGGSKAFNSWDGYWYHTFNASGTFSLVNSLGRTIEYQIVGGGQGGRNYFVDKSSIQTAGGGGGGGDFASGSFASMASGDHAVTVGAGGGNGGGAGTSSAFSSSGSFGTGGGRGGDSSGDRIGYAGTGGSGSGGNGNRTDNNYYAGGGGGGSAGNGTSAFQSGAPWYGGGGGSGTSTWGGTKGGGGGGGGKTGAGGGGSGGGGAGGTGNGTSGSANTGGGGGGAGSSGVGGNGGSGVVIIRYLA